MVCTQKIARKIIGELYGADFKYRITTGATIGVRPMYETQCGAITLVWRRLCAGKEDAIAVGMLAKDHTIDWGWSYHV